MQTGVQNSQRPPGVYFERTDVPQWSVDETRTDIGGFVGITERGPLHRPIPIESWNQFRSRFGNDQLPYAYLPDAVRGFFANGGQTAWIVRVGRPITDLKFFPTIHLVDASGIPVYRIRAKDPGLSGQRISIRVDPSKNRGFHLFVQYDGETLEVFRDIDPNGAGLPSNKDHKNENEVPERTLLTLVNGYDPNTRRPKPSKNRADSLGSHLIEAELLRPNGGNVFGVDSIANPSPHTFGSTRDIRSQGFLEWNLTKDESKHRSVLDGLTLQHFVGNEENEWGLATLAQYNEPSMIAIPDLMWEQDVKWIDPTPWIKKSPCDRSDRSKLSGTDEEKRKPIDRSKRLTGKFAIFPDADGEVRKAFNRTDRLSGQFAMLHHCSTLRDRFAVLDAPPNSTPKEVEAWADSLKSFESQFGAIYYPWIATPSRTASVRWMPPSGHVAGLYARVDLGQGVHKSPANEIVQEARGVRADINSEDRTRLNQSSVNIIQSTAGRGIRVMAARTLIDPTIEDASSWKYICVRRLIIMIEESLEQSAHWLVHAQNNTTTQLDLERVVRQFITRQWRLGRLDGESPEEAFRVLCNETNNPTNSVELARLYCDVAVKPPPPSEYVVIRIGGQVGSLGNWKFGGKDA